jgi:gliding motility-associated lipoprotein GldK
MKKLALIALITTLLFSCKSNDRGQLVGVPTKKKFFSEKPLGTVLIPGGAFTMGKQDEDIAGSLSTPARTVTVRPFYMDETEITNSEYRQFVFWVRDSIIRTRLAILADEVGDGGADDKGAGSLSKYKFKDSTANGGVYYKYMMDNYGSLGDVNSPTEGRFLNWEEDLIYDTNDYPDANYTEVMDSMYLNVDETFDGKRIINADKIVYRYHTFDNEEAARNKGKKRKNYIKVHDLNIYPDTTVWVKDFNYSYNDPMHQDYFSHQAYNDYPVVGVNWHKANAFCNWRTQTRNNFLASKKKKSKGSKEPYFKLPSEAEWEFAARGGYEYAKYPWGGPYTYSDRGCFLANFKPQRGDYALDGALYTMEAKSYNANQYGLYNMAGNVSEWTNTAYNPTSYLIGSTMNPSVADKDNHRKVIRGGSWKDVAYFLEVSTRDFEYGDTARSYIGFRTVQHYPGMVKK